MEEEKVIINKIVKTKINSYEYGKTGQRVKIYYDTVDELKTHLKEIIALNRLLDEGTL